LMHKLGSCIQQHNSSIYSSSVVQRKTYAHLNPFEKLRRNSPINCASKNDHWHGSVKFTQRWSPQPPLARNLRPSLQVRWHACISKTLFCSAFLLPYFLVGRDKKQRKECRARLAYRPQQRSQRQRGHRSAHLCVCVPLHRITWSMRSGVITLGSQAQPNL